MKVQMALVFVYNCITNFSPNFFIDDLNWLWNLNHAWNIRHLNTNFIHLCVSIIYLCVMWQNYFSFYSDSKTNWTLINFVGATFCFKIQLMGLLKFSYYYPFSPPHSILSEANANLYHSRVLRWLKTEYRIS